MEPDPRRETSNVHIDSENEGDSVISSHDAGLRTPRSMSDWYPQGSYPSEVLRSYRPPAYLLTEHMPAADPSSFTGIHEYLDGSVRNSDRDPNFALKANELINQMLGRTLSGSSVIEPDSVLDDSGRLYHGYKDGKYYLPNDAVSSLFVRIEGLCAY